jgi:hypothetical protein
MPKKPGIIMPSKSLHRNRNGFFVFRDLLIDRCAGPAECSPFAPSRITRVCPNRQGTPMTPIWFGTLASTSIRLEPNEALTRN